MSDLTTYGALSCELAFLQSFAICFTLVDQSGERIKLVVMPTSLTEHTSHFCFEWTTECTEYVQNIGRDKQQFEGWRWKNCRSRKKYMKALELYTNLGILLWGWGNWHWYTRQALQWQALQASLLFPTWVYFFGRLTWLQSLPQAEVQGV